MNSDSEEESEGDLEKDSIINDKYIIIKKIGSGGFAKTYLVSDLKGQKDYAAKILFENSSQDDTTDFFNEINILIRLKELPNNIIYITQYQDSGTGNVVKGKDISENRHYLIMNYLSKGNLFKYLDKTKEGFEEKHAKIIFYKILEAIQFLHNSDICHLDINLSNILLDEQYNPIVTDFGLSVEMVKTNNEYELINDEMIRGTTGYISPDMIYGDNGYNGIKADIFSLGVVLFYLVTKKLCFISTRISEYKAFRLIFLKKYDEYLKYFANNNINIKHHIFSLSKNFIDLFFKLVAFEETLRPNSIKEIFEHPWFDEVKKFKNEDYEEYKNMMKGLEQDVENDNETFANVENQGNNGVTGSKSADNEEIFFDSDSTINYLYKSGSKAMNYIIIKGELKPIDFMNSLANKLKKKMKGEIHSHNTRLKLEAKFPNKNQEEIDNMEDIEIEELKDEEKEIEKIIEKERVKKKEDKECVIRIELFEFINGGYEVHFNKGEGEIMDYYSYFLDIKKIIKEILY